MSMPAILRPQSDLEALGMVSDAAARKTSLELVGGGTRGGLGRPHPAGQRLTLAGLSGIILYEPAELVMGAKAGTPLAEIERTLAERGQMLPFEPMDHRPLYGGAGEPTIGGVFAGNVSGPRRLSAGAARDHLLGVTLINGRGQLIRNGGRVMKNVAGLDLVKLSCSAMGTLGLLTEVIFKVLPAPQYSATLAFDGLDLPWASALMSDAMGSPYDIAAAAHMPDWSGPDHRTVLRLEGFESSVRYRLAALTTRLAEYGAGVVIEPGDSADLWRVIRDVCVLDADPAAEIWRIGVAPGNAVELCQFLDGNSAVRYCLDWAGGQIWVAAPAGLETSLRPLVGQMAGHATLVRASDERRLAVPVFQPLAEPLMALSRGLKSSFDPHGIFNPGRMYQGI